MPQGLIIQERDFALLHDLFISRVMTLAHIAKLHFDGNIETAKKRVQKLKRAGYLKQRLRNVNEPSILFLTGKSFGLLSEGGFLAAYPKLSDNALAKRAQVSETTLRHELAVLDVKAAIVPALSEPFKAVEFTTWPRLDQFNVSHPQTRRPFTVKPDGYIRIQEGKQYEYTFFLEVDRSTEAVDTLAMKAACYLQYYKSGGLAVKYGKDRSANHEHPFRVLMVFKSAERRNNVGLRLLKIPILKHAWLCTVADVMANPLGNIWLQPLDLRTALTETPYLSATLQTYERYPEREAFIESHVSKRRLLEDAAN